MVNAVPGAKLNVGPIYRKTAFYKLAPWMLAAAWLLAAGMTAPRLAAQELRGGTVSGDDEGPSAGANNANGTGFTTGNQVNYNGGPVLLGTTKIYFIWYGSWDGSSIGILSNFASHIGGSQYFNINTGYFDGTGASVSNSVSFAGSVNDNYSQGHTGLSDNSIWQVVNSALTHGTLPVDSNGVYFVLTSGDVGISGFGTGFCGYHSQNSYNNHNIQYAFVGNPAPSQLNTCAEQIVSPNANPGADAMASVIAHELEESVTDPGLSAWYDSNGSEIADKCAWTFGATYRAINGSKANMSLGGMDYLIQQDWVNSGGGYCALSASYGPDFALESAAGSQTTSPGGVTPGYNVAVIPVRGFSSSITFIVNGLPTGATTSAISASPTNASFTISAGTAAPGTYPLTVIGAAGSLSHSASATLVISGHTGAADILTIGSISPEPSQVGQSYTVSYSVASSGDGTPTGNVTVSDGSASCVGTVASGSCSLISTSIGTKTITVAYAGDSHFGARTATGTHLVTNGGALPHLTSGGGWETTFAVLNLGPSASAMSLNFFGDSGSPLNLPLTSSLASAAPANATSVNQTLGSNALLLLDTNPADGVPLSEGWANLTSGGDVNAYEIFHYGPSGQEAVVPLQTGGSSYLLIYDNTTLVNTLGTGVAIANGADQTASVPFVVNDDTGTQIASGSVSVPALGHTAFTLSDQYPATAGKRGTLQFTTPPQGQISVLGIRSNGDSFTTIPVATSGVAISGSMAHIVSGGGWRTVFYVANTTGKTSTITLSFFDDAGNPLPLPLTFLQTGTTLTAATITKTLANGATLVIQAQGLGGQVSMGSAKLTSDAGANAFALFRYDPDGQEATVPFETRIASGYVLAFDNVAPLATGVSIANLSSQAATVGMILRDDAGNTLENATIPVPANGHYAFTLGTTYPLASGKRGTVEFDAASGQIAVLGIRANGNAFTSIPVLTR